LTASLYNAFLIFFTTPLAVKFYQYLSYKDARLPVSRRYRPLADNSPKSPLTFYPRPDPNRLMYEQIPLYRFLPGGNVSKPGAPENFQSCCRKKFRDTYFAPASMLPHHKSWWKKTPNPQSKELPYDDEFPIS